MYRGSRKHVLDLCELPSFPVDLLALVAPIEAKLTSRSGWMPRGYRDPDEARLETFGPDFLPDHAAWPILESWWLLHAKGANTPNWDIALGCEIEGRPGLVLVEAKAHALELKTEGKILKRDASVNSRENHDQIARAIAAARSALQLLGHRVCISIESHYQLANRVAFTWKLASLGIPTVLVYLGFTGDEGIREDLGAPFSGESAWRVALRAHAFGQVPDALWETRLDVDGTPAWLLGALSPGPRTLSIEESVGSSGERRGVTSLGPSNQST